MTDILPYIVYEAECPKCGLWRGAPTSPPTTPCTCGYLLTWTPIGRSSFLYIPTNLIPTKPTSTAVAVPRPRSYNLYLTEMDHQAQEFLARRRRGRGPQE